PLESRPRLRGLRAGPELRAGRERPGAVHDPPRPHRAPGDRLCVLLRAPHRGGGSRLAHGVEDLAFEARILLQLGDTLLLATLHEGAVLVPTAGPFVEPARLQDLDVFDPGHALRHVVAEVGVRSPADRAFRDRLDDRARVLDRQLLTVRRTVATADAAGIHQVDLEWARPVEFE